MGGIISRLRAKPTTKELLEDIQKEIENLEDYKLSTEQQHRRLVGSLVFYFILFFIVAAGVFLVYYFPYLKSTKDKILWSIPFLLFPALCFVLKKFLHWYFTQKIKYNDESLVILKKKRRSLLDFAMENESYRVVKDLLEKYDPEYHRKMFFETRAIAPPLPSSLPEPIALKASFGEMEVRKRTSPTKPKTGPHILPGQTITLNTGAGPPPFAPYIIRNYSNSNIPPSYSPPRNNPSPFVRSPMPQMVRPVLPRERTIVDRIVDFMVGDGPSNRYALICRQCQSHNGMALKEDFELIAFRCCYCFHFNPPRNKQQHQVSQSSSSQEPQRLALQAASPVVTEPHTTSEESSADESDKTVETISESLRLSPKSGTESPTLRRRLNISSEEIQAVLEEDKPNYLHADLD